MSTDYTPKHAVLTTQLASLAAVLAVVVDASDTYGVNPI